MLLSLALTLDSPRMLIAALCVGLIGAVGLLRRQRRLAPAAWRLIVAGMIAWCLSAGQIVWRRPAPGRVAVMVDLSPSTRGAAFRQRDQLDRRLHSLLGSTPHQVYAFSDHVTALPGGADDLADLPCEQTAFDPPKNAEAVVLFSDCRFQLPPSAPPTYVVIDPNLETPIDAAVTSLQTADGAAIAHVANAGPPRSITIDGAQSSEYAGRVATGDSIVRRMLLPDSPHVAARLNSGDNWPENDQLTSFLPPVEQNQKWWISESGMAPLGWRGMSPRDLPADAGAYVAPSVIVLQNVSAFELSPLIQGRLTRYVRDLGGGLAILGGDNAFGAGAYAGSAIELLSPLASDPPRPMTHWILLADGSGSMADMQAGVSLWQRAADAVTRLLPFIPEADSVSIGSFSDSLTWWSTGKTPAQTLAMSLPPPGVGPHGPTNLDQTLSDLAASAPGDLPTQLVLLSDAEAEIRDPAAMAEAFRHKRMHLHVLAIGDGSGLTALQQIVSATGGTLRKQLDPARWAESMQTLVRAASPQQLQTSPILPHFSGDLAGLKSSPSSPWNQTWLKATAEPLADGAIDGRVIQLAARWNVGLGRVLSMALDPGQAGASVLSDAVARPPRDPRFRVTWKSEAALQVIVDAGDDHAYLNGRHITIEIRDADADAVGAPSAQAPVPQTEPGRYELALPAPRKPSIASLSVDGAVIDRIAVAGRYAPEFSAIGNDHAAMAQLARQGGGVVVPVAQVWPINFRWPIGYFPLTAPLALFGAALIAAGLMVWKASR